MEQGGVGWPPAPLLCCLLGGKGSWDRQRCFPGSHSSADLGLERCRSVPDYREGKVGVPRASFPQVQLIRMVPTRASGRRVPSNAALNLCSYGVFVKAEGAVRESKPE